MLGSASAAPATAALLRNSRRVREGCFIASTLAKMAAQEATCQTNREKDTDSRDKRKRLEPLDFISMDEICNYLIDILMYIAIMHSSLSHDEHKHIGATKPEFDRLAGH